MIAGEVPPEPEHLIAKAAKFFTEQVLAWAGTTDPSERLSQLARTLRKHVELVVIDLQVGDNAQVIFESLNYGGRELTAIDLTKNHVFFQAGRLDLDLHELHATRWQPFDGNWWREKVVQGRLTRARAELFLMHWLKLERLEEIKAHRLFVDFRDLQDLKADLAGTVDRLARDRDLYRACDENPAALPADTGGFFRRLELLNQSTPRPVALQLLRAVPERLSPDRAARALHALDSYLWRRALTRGSTAAYNRIMLDVLRAVDKDIEHADDAVIATLAGQDGPTVGWPRDGAFRDDLSVRVLYGQGRVARPSVITALRLVENIWREPRGESPIGANATLQLEHMLPQEWRTHWPVVTDPPETFAEREHNRQAHVHRLGNLSLVSASMNASLSNRPWTEKRDTLRQHSSALVTTRYLTRDSWDEAAIRARGEQLLDTLVEIWPGPEGTLVVPPPD